MRRVLGRLWYAYMQRVCQAVFPACFQMRAFGRGHLPKGGGVLLVSNHQSFLDPMLVAHGLCRQVRYLARDSLFRLPGFRGLIRSLGAIPLRRDGVGVSGIRDSLTLLTDGQALLVFPEGTRTRDGRVGPMRGGFGLLAKKAGVPIVPVAIQGAFEAWPRNKILFELRPVRIGLGEPIWPEQVADLGPRDVAKLVRERVIALALEIRPAR
jgi:1-acyl-sn-glycerol-3-phosphate acyltransferase